MWSSANSEMKCRKSSMNRLSPVPPLEAAVVHDAASDAEDAQALDVGIEATPDASAPLCCYFTDSVTGGTAATHCASGVAKCDDAGACSTPLSTSGVGDVMPCSDSCDGSVLVCT